MHALFERLLGARAFVDVEIGKDDDVAGAQRRGELGLDIGVEGRAVDGALDDPGRHQFMATQAGDEGLGVPFSERRIGDEPLTARASSTQRGHVGLDTCFVDEDEPRRLGRHQRLAMVAPLMPGRLHVGPFLLRCQKRFFYT